MSLAEDLTFANETNGVRNDLTFRRGYRVTEQRSGVPRAVRETLRRLTESDGEGTWLVVAIGSLVTVVRSSSIRWE